MDNRKHEAVRALEALEQYYNQLDPVSHAELRQAIDRLMQVFKSRLFQALVDIQTLYQSTLMDKRVDMYEKKRAIDNLAQQIENRTIFHRNRLNDENTNNEYARIGAMVTDNPLTESPNQSETIDQAEKERGTSAQRIETTRLLPPLPISPPTVLNTNQVTSGNTTSKDFIPNETHYRDHWEVIDVDIERSTNQPLGFSVSGGYDSQCIKDSNVILVSKITEHGIAAKSKLLKLHDIILKVNNVDFTYIEHKRAIETLRTSGKNVHLVIRRLSPPVTEEVVIEKPPETALGFSIHGGITHPLYKDDPGIFVSKVVPGGLVDLNGRIRTGDRLISIQSGKNLYDLEYVEHKQAVESIRHACNEGPNITLIVAHITIPEDEIENFLPKPTQPQAAIVNDESTSNKNEGKEDTEDKEKPRSDIPSGQRAVTLTRTSKGFGFNIINHDGRTFISHIMSGGAAEKTQGLHDGDEIIAVNGTSIHGFDNKDVVGVIKSSGDQISIIVIYNYDDYTHMKNVLGSQPVIKSIRSTNDQNRVTSLSKHQFYVKANIDYDPKKDMTASGSKSLAFRAGDMLYITNSADDNWWQARRLTHDFRDMNEYGIIPSSKRFRKKEKARRRRVDFDRAQTDKKTGLFTDKKNSSSSQLMIDQTDFQSTEDSENDTNDSISPYEHINLPFVEFYSPVVILSPLNEIIGGKLIGLDPNKFARPIYETSRSKRDGEVEGNIYRFLTPERMQADIANGCYAEYGELNKNFYGLRLDDIRNIVKNSKHCILAFKQALVENLILENLRPIVISINVPSVEWILENITESKSQETAQRIFDEARNLTDSYADYITATVSGDNLEQVVDRFIAVIDNQRKKSVLTTSIENLGK